MKRNEPKRFYPIYVIAIYYKESGVNYFEFRSLIGAVQCAEDAIKNGNEVNMFEQMPVADFDFYNCK